MPDDAFKAKGFPLTSLAVKEGIADLGIQAAAFWAVMTVETRGFGFLSDRRPKILFERHVFSKRTGRKFDKSHPDISKPTQGGYGVGGANQYARLARAMSLDRTAALESASWGLGQVMGYNHKQAGHGSVQALVDDCVKGEDEQMMAMVRFIASNNLAKYLIAKNWAGFAYRYNGEDFKKNKYDVNLEKAYNMYSIHPAPDLDVRFAQAALYYLGYDPRGIDGVFGNNSQKALIAFQKAQGLPADGKLTATVLDRLRQVAFE